MKATLYTAPWCKPCKELKAWMADTNYGLDITNVNIETDRESAKAAGVKVVPTLIVNGTVYGGREEIKPYLEALTKE